MKIRTGLMLGTGFLLADLAYGKSCSAVFTFKSDQASSVWLSGSFTDWASRPTDGALPLTRTGNTWSVTLDLPPGKSLYKFIIDGRTWVADPLALAQEADAYGGTNSVYACGSDSVVTQPGPQCGAADAFDWRDSVMYFAMIDRFSDSDGTNSPVQGATGGAAKTGASAQYEGGDFAGVTNRMGYLADLGVTSLWLSAPYENRNESGASVYPQADPNQYSAYHGYWPSPEAIDYSNLSAPTPRPQVESRYGSEADLKLLIDTAHGAESVNQKGIKVLFDYVMKHVDINSGLYRKKPEWFTRLDGNLRICGPDNLWDDPYWSTRCSFTDYLPGFDYYNPEVRKWSIDDAVWWAKEFKVDGLRLDAIKHVPIEWLYELRQRLTLTFPEPAGGRFYLVGETFDYFNRDTLKRFVDSKSMLDGQFDFPFKYQACQALFSPEGNLATFAQFLQGNDRYYDRGVSNPSLMVNWLGNHDVPRAIHFASRQLQDCTTGSIPSNGWASGQYQQPREAAPYERLAVAYAVMFTSPGIPLLYYGDEIGLAGGGDPDNRRLMVWDEQQLNPEQLKLRDKVKKLARLRAENKDLGRGQRTTSFVDKDAWVYTMGGCVEEGAVTVAINKSDTWKTVPLSGSRFVDLMEERAVIESNLSLPPRSFRILKAL